MYFLFQVTCKCKYSCKEVVEMKLKLFEGYHSLDLNQQGNYLMGLIDILPVQRRRHGSYDDVLQSRRQATVSYLVPDGSGDFKKVCKNTFLNIFGISSKKVATIIKKKQSGEVIFKDKRGGPKSFKYTLHDRQQVKDHINSFPRDIGHYTRMKSEREYLSQDLNMNRLFNAFLEKYPNSKVSYKFYRKVFLKDFPKLSFRKPRSDTCKTCDYLKAQSKISDQIVSRKAKQQLEMHHRKAENTLSCLKNDTAASTLPTSKICNIVMDLEKVFSLPKLTHSTMYYSRQLSCYNFNIHITDTNDGIMCLWHEAQSGRGGNQMASCILHAINSGVFSTYKKNLVIWSDNCAGQIKNRMLIFLYVYLVSLGLLETIEHKFLLSGHSFSVADRDFALIEKRAKKSKMQVIDDVKNIITQARPTKPFRLLDMTDRFFDFEKAASETIITSKLGISKLSCIKICKENPGYVFYKKSFNDLVPWEQCRVLKKNKTMEDIMKIELHKLPATVQLSQNKKKDLLAMIPYLDENNKNFYRELCQ